MMKLKTKSVYLSKKCDEVTQKTRNLGFDVNFSLKSCS